jgi:PTS system nitrogen regulatory IIA component
MHLTLGQAATHLRVDETTLRRWIKSRGLPVHHVGDRVYLNAVELWEWATANGIAVSRKLLDQERRHPDAVPSLGTLLAEGGIHHDVPGADKGAVLREIVARLKLPEDADREFLLTVLEAREAMGSTGIGDGIAIPHVRNPILVHAEGPAVMLCLLRHPVDFEAVDGVPVHALFTVISPSVPTHLKILAKLGLVLRDAELRRLLRDRAAPDAIIALMERLEQRISGTFAAPR